MQAQDLLISAWEQASEAAISAQNERDAKLRLFLVGLGDSVDIQLTRSLEQLWKAELARREELEKFIRKHASISFNDLKLMLA